MFKILIIIFLFSFTGGFAQNLYYRSYSSNDGLSQNSVYSIAQTNEGFMWFGTQDGLNRFDGKNFSVWAPNQRQGSTQNLSATSKMITALLADTRDNLWVGTSNGILIFDRRINLFMRPEKIFPGFAIPPSTWINQIKEDLDGNYWILTLEHGLFCYHSASGKMVNVTWRNARPNKIISISLSSSGQIFLCSEKDIFRLEHGKFISLELFKKSKLSSVSIVNMNFVSDRLWVIINGSKIAMLDNPQNDNYSIKYFRDEFSGQEYLTDARIIHQSNPNTAWIGSRSEGLIKIDLINKKFKNSTSIGTVASLKRQFVLQLFTGDQEITWIGLSGGGVAEYDARKVQFSLWRNEGLPNHPNPDNMLLSVYAEDESSFYCGTLYGGLMHINILKNEYQYFVPPQFESNSFESKNIYQVAGSENGKLWLATWGGLYSFNLGNHQFTRYTDLEDEQTRNLSALLKLPNQNVFLVASSNGGLRLFDTKTKRWRNCLDPERILDKYDLRVRFMELVGDGTIFMSTETKNLVKYNYQSGSFTFYPQLEQVSGTSRHFHFDSDNIWIATDDGLIQASRDEIAIQKIWNTGNGLPNNYIYSVLADHYHNIWVSSNAGLACLDQSRGLWRKYSVADGLQGMEFNTASCLKDKNDNLWFGGINGLNRVLPHPILQDTFVAAPLITDIEVMNVSFKSDTLPSFLHSIKLPYNQNFINFQFQSPTYSQSENISYAYKMQSVDADWIQNGSRNFASYTQLEPGEYSFMVKAANANNTWSNQITAIQILIIPPWYKTLWFRIISFGFMVGSIWFFIRQRIKAVEDKASLKQKIIETEVAALKAQMNPHFMFNCINSIDAFIQSNDKYNATLYLNRFAKLIRNVLDSSRQNLVSVSKDLDTLKLYIELELLRNDHSFKVIYDIDNELLTGDYKVPPLIVQPFVENAIIHGLKNRKGKNGLLEIKMFKSNHSIHYLIKDNGIGRDATKKFTNMATSSYGLEMSYERVKLFNKEEKASIWIDDLFADGKAVGTEVKVELNKI